MTRTVETVRKTVLIVDDTPENLDILKGILAPFYRVQVATNGRVALKIAFSSTPPDLVLLDVMMPEMDGYEACRLLKLDDRTRDVPVIFVTARSEVDDEARGFELGAADYLVKPVSPPIVLARVRTHLEMHDRRKLLANQVEVRTAQLRLRNLELEETRIEVIRQLGRAAEYRDNETGLHVMRMSRYAGLLARKTGLSDPEADQIMNAAPMHDIGKIGIRDAILLKPGKLTAEEFAVIQTHPEIGYRIIGPQSSDILQLGGLIALTHHEKWNGRGYPRRLAGEEIPLAGRLCAVGDVFDALTARRPYKAPWSVDDALALLVREAGEHFDPRLVSLFVDLKEELVEIMGRYGDESA
ncbi:MAG: two-component system response regulator [Magnetococcales bacterium]|nr:two-component system response regulator [Magnetococcales bacterium]MBF0156973.1 two-component system response regulator [Magnetococcales bacterium]